MSITRRGRRTPAAALAVAVVAGPLAAAGPVEPPSPEILPRLTFPAGVRFASFNASLNRSDAGELVAELAAPGSAQPAIIAQIIQRNDPDVLLINEFDYDAGGEAIAAFREAYLRISEDGAVPAIFNHVYLAPSNTGVPSGFDLNNDGSVGGPDDAFGFGFFPGQFGMVLLSKYPIVTDEVRTFQEFLWADMPGALLPDDPKTPEEADWYSPEELEVFRLSSKSHWDVPIDVDGAIVHVLASHPTPPVFDGPEDRNGLRNHDEIRFWADYVTPGAADYIYDDEGGIGGLPEGRSFVVMGDLNADPNDGDSTDDPIGDLFGTGAFNLSITPASPGGIEQSALQGGANDDHVGNPAFDTADFNPANPGNLRVDYALPSADLPLAAAGVFWPLEADPLFPIVGTFPFPSSDHRLVYVDLALPGSTLPNGVAAGDTDATSTILWTNPSTAGDVLFEVSLDATFSSIIDSGVATTAAPLETAKVEITDLTPGTTYFYRAVDSAGSVGAGTVRTAHAAGSHGGLRFGISGDWRGELSPYPAIANADERDLEFFVAFGDTIYADFESPVLPGVQQAVTLDEFRLKYTEVYGERFGVNAWADLRSVTTTYATIDDHEVTNDFAGGADPASDPRFAGQPGEFINETPLYANGLQAFQEAHPMRLETYAGTGDPRFDGKPRLYRSRRFGDDAILVVTDARSFRDEALPPVLDPTDEAAIIAFLAASFDPSRTMLGFTQTAELLADLQTAQDEGVLWKFVLFPEPIQNLGVVAASDRFEGYAAERSIILSFVEQNGIENVVFVCADIHGTVVNNLQYQEAPFGPQIDTTAFEISTGSVAFDAPFGPTVVEIAFAGGLITEEQYNLYLSLPPFLQDQFVEQAINDTLAPLGYDPIGLDGAPVDASLLQGGWTATHSYGWTEFDIDGTTGRLLITTYGIVPYSRDEMNADPEGVSAREPMIMQQFVVFPGASCRADLDGDGMVGFSDLLEVLSAFGTDEPSADVIPDGTVDFDDLLFLLGAYGPCG